MKHFLFSAVMLFVITCANSQGFWTQKASFGGVARYGATGFTIGTKGYMGLGINGAVCQTDFWEYDPVLNSWTQVASLPGNPRFGATGFSIGTKGYVGTGYDATVSGSFLNDFYEYDPVANSWLAKASFPGTPRYHSVSFAIGQKGYIGTGWADIIWFNSDFWEYDVANDTWTQIPDIGGSGRRGATAFSNGTKGYVGSGANSSPLLTDYWEYDPLLNSWSSIASLPALGRFYAVGFVIGNTGYTATGLSSNSSNLQDLWSYNISTNVWTAKANFPGMARYQSAGFAIGNKGYVGAGSNFTINFNDFWEYTPDTITAIPEINTSQLLSVYPNPVNNVAFISGDFTTCELFVYNSNGSLCIQQSLTSGNKNFVSFQDYPDGVYFLKAKCRNSDYISKIIVRH